MANDKVTFDFEVVDKASKAMKSVEKSTRDVEKSFDGLDKKGKQTSKSTDKLGGSAKKTGGMLKGLGPVAIGTTAAIAGIAVAAKAAYDAVAASVNAYEEQYDVNNRLKNTLRVTADESVNLTERYAELQGTIGQLAQDTNFADEEISKSLSTLQDLSGQALDSTEAHRQMNTVLGIAAQREMDAEAAAKLYAKAKNGEVRALKKVLPLTKDQARELDRMEDGSERARIATEMLDEQYGGMAQRLNQGLFASLKNTQDALGDTQQAFGEVVAESGAFTPIIDIISDALIDLQDYVAENSEEWQHWLIDVVDTGLEYLSGFVEVLQKASPVLAAVATAVRTMSNVWQIWSNVVQIIWKTIAGFVAKALGGLYETVGKILDRLSGFAGYLNDDLAAAINTGAEAFDGLGSSISDLGGAALDSARGDIDDIATDIGDIGDAITSMGDVDEGTQAALQSVLNRLNGARDKLDEARATVGDENVVEGKGRGGRQRSAAPEQEEDKKTDDSDKKEREKERLREIHWRDQIAAMDLQIAQASGEQQRARLEYQKAQLELARDISEEKVTEVEAEARMAQLERQHQQTLAQIEKQRDAEKKKRRDEAHDKYLKQVDEQIEAQRKAGETIARAFGDNAFGSLTSDLTNVITGFRTMRKEGESVESALSASFAAGEQAISGFMQEMGVNQEIHNALMAATSTARGFYNLATQNYPAAGAAFTAAGIYGAHAIGGAISAGGASKGVSSGGSQASQSSGGASRDDAMNIAYQAHLKALRDARGESNTVNNYNFQGATFLDGDVSTQRRVSRATSRQNRLSIGGQ